MEDSANLHPKLVPNLRNKTNYIIHYRNLKLYLELGLRLTNVHRVLSFDQSPWLKNYINFKTRQRTAAKNDFKKDSLSWSTTRSLIMLSYVYLFFFVDLFIAGKAFIFMLICSYVLIHSLIHSLLLKFLSLCLFVVTYWFIHYRHSFYLYVYLSLFIDSFIEGVAFIFMFICFYVLIHSLQVQLLSL